MDATEFGSYLLVRRVGVGGMAEVFEAKRIGPGGFEKTLAVKRIRPAYLAHPDWVPMFMEEARIAATLDHPNIVQVHDFGEVEGSYFIGMEYVDGVDLSQALARQKEIGIDFPAGSAAHLVGQILAALEYAHGRLNRDGSRAPVIHRDVSPPNVLLSFDGHVKLTDFGIAKALGSDMPDTQPGVVKGKIYHMAPEQVAGEAVDERTDLFSVGIILYTLLAGARPFAGASRREIAERIVAGTYTPLRKLKRDVPPALERIVERSLETDRAKRFQSAAEFARELRLSGAAEPSADYRKRLAAHLALLFGKGAKRRDEAGRFLKPDTVPEIESSPSAGAFGLRPPRRWSALLFLTLFSAALLLWGRPLLRSLRRGMPPRAPESPPAAAPAELSAPSRAQTEFSSPPPAPAAPREAKTESPPLPEKPARPLPAAAFGSLTIFPSGPYATVYLDGKEIGNTPIVKHRLKSGRHSVVFANRKLGWRREMVIVIRQNQELRLTEIWEGSGQAQQ